MRNGYTSLDLRRQFEIQNESAVDRLQLRFFSDDGFVMWINGVLVTNFNKTGADFNFDTTATTGASEPLQWLSHTLGNPRSYLVEGMNQVAILALNPRSQAAISSSISNFRAHAPI